VVIGVVRETPRSWQSISFGGLQACGYRVVDLGAQVSREEFERAVVENRADILALSAMMSTTMGSMPEIIKTVRIVSPGTVVMVGGAPLDRKLAELYGADGYAESAVTVLEETEAALGKRTGAAQVHVSQGVHP
jgi:methanogenic corrinoid protein MtbC1